MAQFTTKVVHTQRAAVAIIGSLKRTNQPGIVRALRGQVMTPKEAMNVLSESTPHCMSDTEKKYARLVAIGMTNSQIAAHLAMSVSTVKCAVARAMKASGVTNRVQLAVIVNMGVI